MPVDSPRHAFSVLPLLMQSGERLPILVDSNTWLPARFAMRWTILMRHKQVQSSTLAGDLRILNKLYTWAALQQIELDSFLREGNILDERQIESLTLYYERNTSSICSPDSLIDVASQSTTPSSFNHHLSVTKAFLIWVLRTNHGLGSPYFSSFEELEGLCNHIEYLLDSKLLPSPSPERIRPLTEEEIIVIRSVISPKRDGRRLTFSPTGFTKATCLRNWLMFEMSLGLGLRRGEILKLRLDGITRGRSGSIQVVRLPDDPLDSRRREPAVKTAERVLVIEDPVPIALHAYLTSRPPLGRFNGKSPYLFVTRTGEPVSIDTADDIIESISRKCGVPLSWHSLRHTWAEKTAKICLPKPNGLDLLMYLGGWTSPRSVKRYIQNYLSESANELLKAHNQEEA